MVQWLSRPLYSSHRQPCNHDSRAALRSVARAAPATGRAPWRSALGPESKLPNLYWGAMSPASLRYMSYFTALQPEEQVLLEGQATYRYVRQGTALWSALHAGRLTTSRLKDALGLRDPTAARIVGGPQYSESGVLQAYNHLLQPLFVPPVSTVPMTSSTTVTAPEPAAVTSSFVNDAFSRFRSSESNDSALQFNEYARLRFNEAMMMRRMGEMESVSMEKGAGFAAEAGRQTVMGSRLPIVGGGGDARRYDGFGSKDSDSGQDGWSREEDRRRISELAALATGSAGAVRMRLLWGSSQEAAAVATLALLFPVSQLEEVGLLCLSDSRPWGVESGDLPHIGASPDALITHYVPITRGDIQAGRNRLAAAAAAATSQVTFGAVGGVVTSELGEAVRRVARSVLRLALVRHTERTATVGAMPGGGVAYSRSSGRVSVAGSSTSSISTSSFISAATSTATTGAAAAATHPRRLLPLFSCGCDWEEALEWMTQELLRPAGSLSDAQAQQQTVGQQRHQHPNPHPHPHPNPHQHQHQHQQAGGQEPLSGCGIEHVSGNDDEAVVAVVPLREVVEVKNHCPFVYKGQRKARKRGLVLDYVVRDRGPIEAIWPLWVPQLQAHMACSGAESALLLSRSASKGVHVLRMFRDDSYIEIAFDILRELQYSHVAHKHPPGCDPWANRPGYTDFVQQTVALARGAETVVLTSATPQVPGTDQAAFWPLK